jgi:hypothetical protein
MAKKQIFAKTYVVLAGMLAMALVFGLTVLGVITVQPTTVAETPTPNRLKLKTLP